MVGVFSALDSAKMMTMTPPQYSGHWQEATYLHPLRRTQDQLLYLWGVSKLKQLGVRALPTDSIWKIYKPLKNPAEGTVAFSIEIPTRAHGRQSAAPVDGFSVANPFKIDTWLAGDISITLRQELVVELCFRYNRFSP